MPLCFSSGEFGGKYEVAENLDRSYGDGSDKMFQWAEVCSDVDLPLNLWQKGGTSGFDWFRMSQTGNTVRPRQR